MSFLSETLPALKHDLSQAKTYVKTAVWTAVSAGAGEVYQIVTSPGHQHDLFTKAGLLGLKHSFVNGAFVALIALFVPSPLKATTGTTPAAPAAPADTPTPSTK